jgi:hypothetical protein
MADFTSCEAYFKHYPRFATIKDVVMCEDADTSDEAYENAWEVIEDLSKRYKLTTEKLEWVSTQFRIPMKIVMRCGYCVACEDRRERAYREYLREEFA